MHSNNWLKDSKQKVGIKSQFSPTEWGSHSQNLTERHARADAVENIHKSEHKSEHTKIA